MGRNLQPLRSCDLCEFSSRNRYLFKRHFNRCRRHKKFKLFESGAKSIKPSTSLSKETMESSPDLEENPLVIKEDPINQEMSEAADDTSMDVDDSSLIEGSPMNHSFDEFPEISGSSSAGGILPPPNVCRNYHCQECSFTTTKSKMFLYHQIDVHSANFNVFPCDFCEYASRWKHKLLRHKEKAHKVTVTMEELQPEYTASKTPPVPTSPKQKKPSSPAKYTASNPTIKLKKSRTHLSKNNNLDSCSMYIERLSTIFNGASVFKCKLCLYTSKTRMQAYKHVYSCHVKAKVFKCKVCSFSTEKKIDFYIHKSKHTNENFYQCKECLYGTTLKTNYDRHMLNHEMTSAFTCNLCSYSSPNEGALKRHLTNHHSNSEENVSLIVSKTSASAVDIKPQPDEKPLRGSFSGVGENSVAVTFEEQNEKVDADDDQEDDDNNDDDDDDDDDNNNNSNNNNGSGGSSSSSNNNSSRLQRFQKSFCYRCRICGLKYKRSPDMNRHMKLKHNISIQEFKKLDLERQYQVLNSVDNDNAENNDSNEENFRGGDEDGGPLDLSIKTMRSIFSKTKLKCTYCSYIAKWPCDLRRHMAVHSVDKRYKCHLCMRKYKYFGDLNVHIRRDHDIEPDKSLIEKVTTVQKKKSSPTIFKCPSCSFTSNYKSEIDRHSKLHDGNKPYKCKLCKYQSHWKGDMNRHLYRHHPNEVQQEDDIKNLVIYQKVINPELIASSTESSTDTTTASATVTVATITSTTSTSATSTPTSTKETSTKLTLSSADEDLDSSDARAEEIAAAECSSSPNGVNNFEIVKEDNSKIGLRTPELDHVSMAMVTKETGSSNFTDVTDDSPQKDVVGPFLCKYCDFSAPAPSKLKAHLATHLNLKKFKCPICGKRSNWKWDIRKHIRKEHPGQSDDVIVMSEQEAEATVLKYMETMPTNRREHQLNVAMLKPKKLFKCSQCNFQSAFRWTVLKHLRNDHADNSSSKITENSGCESVGNSIIIGEVPETIVKIEPGTIPPKAIASQTISTSSGKPASLASFVPKPAVVVSGSGTPVLSVPMISKLKSSKKDSKSSSDKPYMCPLCGKRTTFRGDVRKHYRYMHPGEEIRILYVGTLSNEEILSKTNVIKMTNSPSPIKKEKISVSGSETSKSSEASVKSPQSISDTTLILASDKLKDTPEHTTALEALYSNPKRVGYIKPFKCSACGRRSNWKWDLKKHIRERHPEDGYVIVMEEEEARRSLLAVCYPNHPLVTKQADGAATSDASLTPVTSAAQRNAQKMWRQFECSGCGYKSNWRSDVYRHIKRRHNNNRSKIICIDHKTSDYPPPFDFKFKKSESSYEKKSAERSVQAVSLEDGTASTTTEISMVPGLSQASQPATTQTESGTDSVSLLGHGKMWKCNKCSYRHKDKMLVMRHLTSHKVKPYKCKLCGHSSNYRSALYRHLRQKHGRNDYSLCKLSISYSADSEGTAASGDENDTGIGDLLDLYTCKICKFQSTWKACLYRHLREQHGTTDYNNCFMKTSTENGDEEKPAPIEIRVPLPDRSSDKPNRFQCNVCPYSTKKQTLLKFHMSYHKPRGQNRFKCKFCPYYVCARRLLNQHIRLHSNELAKNKMSSKLPEPPDSPSPSKKEEFLSPLDINVSPKTASSKRMRYSCEKCPYATNSKNDFLYHKQFHRVKLSNTAAFKCDYCDYWVSHRRLLKQHLRLHTSPEPDCIQTSPAKSEPPDINLMYDAVEIASVKQKLISSKILPKLTPNEEVGSPLKIAARFATFGDKSGYICKNGVYKKLLKCPKCPYTNIRVRNLRLHQQMHGLRSSAHPLLKCPHCDYYVGSKGLLSHHLKVHQHQYVPDPNDDTISEMEMMEGINLEGEDLDDKEMEISHENRVDALIEIANFKKFCCEKCPYASAKRMHFERHIELHGSKQRYTCDYCDYSVPSNNLLVQHRKLHFSPNPNLVATQSISNLQRLPEIPADLALASVLPPMDSNDLTPLAVTHDHLNLYENAEPEKDDTEPKKLYRCDRCPYSNTRRDHMLTHLKFHMIQSELACPYCDYSVSKNHLLSQHIRVHFSPLPELSNWLTENGQKHRIEQAKDQDLSEALHIAQLYQQNKKQTNAVNAEIPAVETTTTTTTNNNNDDNSNLEEQSSLVCQYCDRSFTDSAAVLKHERQHLIGNQFECCILQNMAELAPAVATC